MNEYSWGDREELYPRKSGEPVSDLEDLLDLSLDEEAEPSEDP